jgi:hypothetical protein
MCPVLTVRTLPTGAASADAADNINKGTANNPRAVKAERMVTIFHRLDFD